MMTNPITPPPELVKQWANACPYELDTAQWVYEQFIAASAAQWGADQELEACCEWLHKTRRSWDLTPADLRAARRPKPPSLKEQALAAFYAIAIGANDTREQRQDLDTIRRALEELPD
jgi:hypothetical protein